MASDGVLLAFDGVVITLAGSRLRIKKSRTQFWLSETSGVIIYSVMQPTDANRLLDNT